MANGNGNDLWNDMPWWVKAVALVGVPSLISVGIVASDRWQLSGAVKETAACVERVENAGAAHDARMLLRFDELKRATEETNRILVATCVNAAQTMEARERCIGR